MTIFQTVEFYIIAAVVAAAIVAASALPSKRGAARTFLFGGTLAEPRTPDTPASDQGIIVQVDDFGYLNVYRFGLEGVHEDGAYSLAVEIAGFDVVINERLTAGSRRTAEMTQGRALLDCFGRERYHIQYKSESTGRSCAFSLNMAPGNRIERRLEL